MIEFIHAVITSLLLSAAMGGGVDKSAPEQEPDSPETGVDVGKMPSYLVSPRGLTSAEQHEDDHQPVSLDEHASFCEPAVWVEQPFLLTQGPAPAALFSTAGRSP